MAGPAGLPRQAELEGGGRAGGRSAAPGRWRHRGAGCSGGWGAHAARRLRAPPAGSARLPGSPIPRGRRRGSGGTRSAAPGGGGGGGVVPSGRALRGETGSRSRGGAGRGGGAQPSRSPAGRRGPAARQRAPAEGWLWLRDGAGCGGARGGRPSLTHPARLRLQRRRRRRRSASPEPRTPLHRNGEPAAEGSGGRGPGAGPEGPLWSRRARLGPASAAFAPCGPRPGSHLPRSPGAALPERDSGDLRAFASP
ncbi:uncharacterized protein DOCK8-AS1-like [Canis lupus dingo]|uniref:uncharacterized protein DOCK8-AS1-like n=1 Tax=Canis lupus dingo TaxID=286419 RepID=UPI0020C5AA80|nr:uncharacterized protein DOCK8-AS1-like [Canis lupus dingo]